MRPFGLGVTFLRLLVSNDHFLNGYSSFSPILIAALIADDGEEGEEVDPQKWHHAIVSVKSFLQFLSSYVVSTTTIACLWL